MCNKVANLIKHTDLFCRKITHTCNLSVKYVTETRGNVSIHLCQPYRPGMGKEELQHKKNQTPEKEGKLVKTRDKL